MSRDWTIKDEMRRTSTAQVKTAYEDGFVGAYSDPDERDKLRSEVEWPNAVDAADSFGWAGSGAGKLNLLFPLIEGLWPGTLPGPAQQRGDCVAHSTVNAATASIAAEIHAGEPDEVTGVIEGPPEISDVGIKNGSFSVCPLYWHRRHGGDGWSCSAAARVLTREQGLWVCKDYPELGIDLTRYSGSLCGRYGRSLPPEPIREAGKKHLIRTATEPDSFQEIEDLISNGYGISSCGGEGFSSRRNEDGVSNRRGSWSHAMAYLATDSRPWVKEKYKGEPGLVLVQNSWGKSWISGPRKIHGTSIDIPHGSFWARWSDIRRRYTVAFSGVNGWPARELPDWGSDFWRG